MTARNQLFQGVCFFLLPSSNTFSHDSHIFCHCTSLKSLTRRPTSFKTTMSIQQDINRTNALRGILDSDYAKRKQALMALVNAFRAEGISSEIE